MIRRITCVVSGFAIAAMICGAGVFAQAPVPPNPRPVVEMEPKLEPDMWVAVRPEAAVIGEGTPVQVPTYPRVYRIVEISTNPKDGIKYKIVGISGWTTLRDVIEGELPADKIIGPNETYGVLTAMIRKDPRNAELHDSRGLISQGLRRLPEAIRDFAEALRLNPNSSATYLNRATVYYAASTPDLIKYGRLDARSVNELVNAESSKLQRALGDITEAIRIDPDSDELYQWRAMIAFGLKHYSRSVEDATKVLRGDPTNINTILTRAFAFESLKEQHLAIGDYTRLLDLQTKNAKDVKLVARLGRATCQHALKQYKKADEDITCALKIEPADLEERLRRAETLISLDKVDEAIEDYVKVIKEDRKNVEALRGLGKAYRSQEKYAEAAENYEAVLAVKKDVADYFTLANIHKRANNLPAAIDAYDRLLKYSTDEVDAHLNRAEVHVTTKSYDYAKKDYEAVLAIEPDNAEINAKAKAAARAGLVKLQSVKSVDLAAKPKELSPTAKATADILEQAAYEEAVTRLEVARTAAEQTRLAAKIAAAKAEPAKVDPAKADPAKPKPVAKE